MHRNASAWPTHRQFFVSLPRVLLVTFVAVAVLGILTPRVHAAPADPLDIYYEPAIDTNPADYPNNIWVTDDMQKVRQDSGSPGAQHWGTFYGTENEFVDFQVHVQAPAGGIAN